MNLLFQRDLFLSGLAALIALTVPVLVYHKTNFKPELTAPEQVVVNFTPTQLQLNHKTWQQTQLTPPVSAAPQATLQAPGTEKSAGLMPQKPPTVPPSVSFILNDGAKSMAIISGNLVKTGDQFKGWHVERIERNRVLLRNRKGTTWLTLD